MSAYMKFELVIDLGRDEEFDMDMPSRRLREFVGDSPFHVNGMSYNEVTRRAEVTGCVREAVL